MWTKKTNAIIFLAGAWVLWVQRDFGKWVSDWQTVDGYQTYQECRDSQKFSSQDSQKRYKSGESEAQSIFQCLPDTVDPRTPKTKGKDVTN